jgi:hypothetical protein
VEQFEKIKPANATKLTYDVRGRIEKRQESYAYLDLPGGCSFWIEEKYIIFLLDPRGERKNIIHSIFSTLYHEHHFEPMVEPVGFIKFLPVLKSVEVNRVMY